MSGKKIYLRIKDRLWLVLVALSFVLFAGGASAQSDFVPTTGDLYPSLVSESSAESMLQQEIPSLESTMNILTPDTPVYEEAERKYLMFVHTWENLTTGMQLEEALTSTYGEFAIDSNGNALGEDELPALVNGKNIPVGDSVFDELVSFLEL